MLHTLSSHMQIVMTGNHRKIFSGTVPVNAPAKSPILFVAGQPIVFVAGQPALF